MAPTIRRHDFDAIALGRFPLPPVIIFETRTSVKSIFSGILTALVLSSSALAIRYEGTILETITSTNDPLYAVGQMFTGSYQYDSADVDGTFRPRHILDPLNPNQLRGFIFVPGRGEELINGNFFASRTFMTVSGGEVTDFVRTDSFGALEYTFRGSGFSVRRDGFLSDGTFGIIGTSGTVSFSNPVANVPEGSTSTAWLLLGGMFAVAVIRPLADPRRQG